MSNSQFSILQAVTRGYRFVAAEWRYLAGASILPVAVTMATSLFLQFMRKDASLIEGFIWGLPSAILGAWFMFIESRLILLGERLGQMPQDPEYKKHRDHAMHVSVTIWILFNMALMSIAAFMEWGAQDMGQAEKNPLVTGFAMLLIGTAFWGARFGVAHILAAVDYSIKTYLFRVNGIEISLRLIGLSVLAALPAFFVLQLMIAALFPTGTETPTDGQLAVVCVLSAFLSFMLTAVVNAAACFAMKDLLSRPARGRVI